MKSKKISVIIPCYNGGKFIRQNAEKINDYLANNFLDYEIIIVNDGSIDKTSQIVESRGVRCLSHLVNLGKGAAMKTGCDYAFRNLGAAAVVIMDGDDQHDPEDIVKFDQALKAGNEIVLGVRSLDAKMPLARVLGNKSMSILINLIFGRYLADIPSGFKAMTKKAYGILKWHSSGYEVETEIAVRIAKSRLSCKEVPISTVYHDKDYGFNLLDAWRILIKIPYWIWR